MFFAQIINGLMLGSTYSLVAIGYTLIFGVLGLLHFAHGEVFMMGAFIGLQMVILFQSNIYVALIGAMVGAAVLGVIIEYLSFRPINKTYHMAPLISTIGASIILQEVGVKIFGGDILSFPEAIKATTYKIGNVPVTSFQLLIFASAVVLMVLTHLFIKRTRVGKAMRATAESSEDAWLMGVNVNRITTVTFIISSALAGAAGFLVGLVYNAISPFMGTQMVLKGFTIMLLGGLGNVFGAMVGGLFLGLVEVFSVGYLASSYKDGFAFGIMFVLLIFKPSGLFGSLLHDERRA